MKVLELLQENWLALISLIVALVGGVPGLILVFNEWKARPKLAAYLYHLIPIQVSDVHGRTLVGLVLHVAIANRGKEPLLPLVFQLECKISKKWVPFEAGSIPEGFKIDGIGWQYEYTNVAENDIQKQKKPISRESVLSGFIAFVSKEISFDELNAVYMQMPIKIKCIDIFDQAHELVLKNDLMPNSYKHTGIPPGEGVRVKRN